MADFCCARVVTHNLYICPIPETIEWKPLKVGKENSRVLQ